MAKQSPSHWCNADTSAAGPRSSEDNRAYGSLETNTETDQTADTDASESNLSANRRRRSRRRRTDNEATLMDGESDNASVSENGIGKPKPRRSHHLSARALCWRKTRPRS